MNNLLTTSEVARILRVDDTTVLRWIQHGALAAISLPHAKKHRYRIKRETIEMLLGGPLQGRL